MSIKCRAFWAIVVYLLLSTLLATASHAADLKRCTAGQGVYNEPILLWPDERSEEREFQKDRDYISVDAVCWYVHATSTWLSEKTVSGTLRVRMGSEEYGAVLGSYRLGSECSFAPLFNEPLVCTRVYRGERPQLVLLLSAIKKNTLLGALLKDLGSASLGIARGAVQGASVAGPSQALTNAGAQLLSGAEQLLRSAGSTELLSPSGIRCTLTESQLNRPVNYVLLHKGSRLRPTDVTLDDRAGKTVHVRREDSPLDDGAWVLIRIRRECRFAGRRPWEDAADSAVAALDHLMMDQMLQPTEALDGRLKPSGNEESPNEADMVLTVRNLIQTDAALTSFQKTFEKLKLVAYLKLAQDQAKPGEYLVEKGKLEYELASGQQISNQAVRELFDKSVVGDLAPKDYSQAAAEAVKRQAWETFRAIAAQQWAQRSDARRTAMLNSDNRLQ